MRGALELFRIVRANVCLNFAIPSLFWFLIFGDAAFCLQLEASCLQWSCFTYN